jgi:GNAT superfamily N-acetyltransferase
VHPDAADLAPGDAWAGRLDWSAIDLHRVRSVDDPAFARAYAALWGQFGSLDEMEQRDVITSRLAWDPRRPVGGCALLYEMIVLERAGALVAVRDHTAILPLEEHGGRHVVVHLSHALVMPSERGTGLGAWLRALPLEAARACARAAGVVPASVTLVAEMEPPDPASAERMARLRLYARAGFGCVDPEHVAYRQPDFRPPAEIDATGVQPLPLALMVRRVGAEDEAHIAGRELRAIVHALYTMYAVHQRHSDMAMLWPRIAALPGGDEQVPLLSFAS